MFFDVLRDVLHERGNNSCSDLSRLAGLFIRHNREAYEVARSIVTVHEDAEDVVQTAFLRAYTTLNRLRPGSTFAPWLFRIVVNTAHDLVRRRRIRMTEELSRADATSCQMFEADSAERTELRERLNEALSTLPNRMKAIVVLSLLEDYSHGELAEMFNIPVGTARSELWHGRHRLRHMLSDLWNTDDARICVI